MAIIIITILFLSVQFSTLRVAQAQQAPATVGLATSPTPPGVQTDRRHAMLPLPHSITGQQKPNVQPAPEPNAPKMMPIYPPGSLGH